MRSLTKLLLAVMFVAPAAARADWLNLSDGVWDLTLSCVFVDPNLTCPGSFHASITVSGAGATALSTTFNNESFSGDPVDADFSHMSVIDNVSHLINPNHDEFDVAYDSPSAYGLAARSWGYCTPIADGCSLTYGSWTATPVSPVPEPSQWALVAVGLSGMAAMRFRAQRAARPR